MRFIAPGANLERIALAVAVHDAAVEKLGDGRKPDVGMRANVHASAGDELHRSDLIEEDERTNHLALACGSARCTEKPPPRSRTRGTIIKSSASQDRLSPSIGSCAGIQLIAFPVSAASAATKCRHRSPLLDERPTT
jgi:hypothetical protein